MKPEIVVFDLGKVLVDFDYGIAAERLAAQSRVSIQEIQTHLDHSPLLFEFETGRLSREEFYQAFRQFAQYQGDIERFTATFADIFTPMKPMVALHQSLKKRGVPTYIFSNTNDIAVSHIRRQFPFFSTFDDYVYSYLVGSMKPDAKIYQEVESVTQRSGSAILYIDDRPENVDAGRNRGWQVIQQISSDQTIQQIQELGLLP